MTANDIDAHHARSMWRSTAKSRLHMELAGLAFAVKNGFSPKEYARHLWGKGAVAWMGKDNPDVGEYLRKEVEAFQRFYPDVAYEIVEAGKERAELVFTGECLGSWGEERWKLAKSLGLTQKDVCGYCHEAFRVWAEQLGLVASNGPEKRVTCRLRVNKP